MWQLFLDRFSAVPGWTVGSGVVMALMLVLLLFSFFRNVRTLAWFSLASLLTAGIFLLTIRSFPLLTDWLVSYRSDWSLLYLSQTIRASTLLIHFIIYFSIYSVLAIVLILSLGIWSLLTFRWQRWRIILQRAFSESWLVFFFAFFSVLIDVIFGALLPIMKFDVLSGVFQLMTFLFCLQLFLRLTDTAYLRTPQLFMEFTFASGLWMLLFRFVADLVSFLGQTSPTADMAKSLFLNHLFSFFLGVLLLGILAHFFVRTIFSRTHKQQKIPLGVVSTAVLGAVFLLLVFGEWYLALIPAFFLGYFLQFYLLDRQDDWRVKGDLMSKRMA